MKIPSTVKSLAWKYLSASQEEKNLFGDEVVVPAGDLIASLDLLQKSMNLNRLQCEQTNLLLKFLRDHQSILESHEFQVLLSQANHNVNRMLQEELLIESSFKKLLE